MNHSTHEDLTPEQVRKLWTDALRSGEYKQGTGTLRQGNQFCCLGVLCELAVEHRVIKTYCANDGVLRRMPEVVRWVGLQNFYAHYDEGDDESLPNHNDDGMSFEDIADIIDSKPAGLFVDA